MELIPLTWGQTAEVFMAGFAVLSTAMAGLWKVMNGQVKQWKDLYNAIKNDPTPITKSLLETSQKVITDQIAKLEKTVTSLEAQIKEKDEEIRILSEQLKRDEKDYIFQVERREKLERTLTAYLEVMDPLVRRFNFTSQVIRAFDAKVFDVSQLDDETQNEIKRRVDYIVATSFSKTQQQRRADAEKRAVQKAAEQRMKLGEIARREAMLKDQMSARAELPMPGDEPKRRPNKNKRR
jgi:hypothetical protein